MRDGRSNLCNGCGLSGALSPRTHRLGGSVSRARGSQRSRWVSSTSADRHSSCGEIRRLRAPTGSTGDRECALRVVSSRRAVEAPARVPRRPCRLVRRDGGDPAQLHARLVPARRRAPARYGDGYTKHLRLHARDRALEQFELPGPVTEVVGQMAAAGVGQAMRDSLRKGPLRRRRQFE